MNTIQIEKERYVDQIVRWPNTGKVILAQHDDEGVIVYQAYNKSIGLYAAANGRFGGEFSLSRMTWIKPNFLWMMYRSGWGLKESQEVTLAVKIKRYAFEQILELAVPSSFDPERYETRDAWQSEVKESDVRLQWDPDHDPHGKNLDRRAIQLGLRGAAVQSYASDWLINIWDISEFVSEQREHVEAGRSEELVMPKETIYVLTRKELIKRLGLDTEESR